MKQLLLLVPMVPLLSCGGDDGLKCDNNDCHTPGRTTVKWEFDAYPNLMFDDDTCLDVGAANVRVQMTNKADATITQSMDGPCGNKQIIFLDLPAGTYDVSVTPLDDGGNSLVTAAAMDMVVGGTSGADTEITINVPYTSWTMAYTGTFYFRLKWNGMSCEAHVPAIATQTLTLKANGGAIYTGLTDMGQKVDGTDPEACRKLSEATAQSVQGVPFGPATFIVVGKDSAGTVQLQKSFDTFVGANKNNPEIDFDVVPPDAPPAVDAGVDAPAADASVDAM